MMPVLLNPWESAGLPDEESRAEQPRTAQFLAPEGFNPSDLMTRVIFGGLNARNADRDALHSFKEMEAAGADRGDIWRATGWYRGVDKKPRFEISDDEAELIPGGKTAAAAINHPKLFEHYPELRNVAVVWRSDLPQGSASYRAASAGRPETIEISSNGTTNLRLATLLHELDHAVQERELFAPGTSQPRMQQLIKKLGGVGPRRITDAQDAYEATAGEVQADNVENRWPMTRAARRATPPWETQSIPDDQQIILRREDGMPLPFAPRRTPVSNWRGFTVPGLSAPGLPIPPPTPPIFFE